MCLEVHPGLVILQLGPPGFLVLLELSHLYNKIVCNLHNLSFSDGLAFRCFIIDSLVEPYIEALKRLVRVEQFLQIGIFCREVRGGDLHIVAVEVTD